MKNIYWISATAHYPVCTAGAVVIASNKKEALTLVPELHRPAEPELIGVSKFKKNRVIVTNNGDY